MNTGLVAEEQVKSKRTDFHAVFFPLLAHGHIIPLFDIARLFAAQDGVVATFVTTPANVPAAAAKSGGDQRDQDVDHNNKVNIEIIPFPSEEVGLPPGTENAEYAADDEASKKFYTALLMLQDPLEKVIHRLKPISCLVSDMFLPWSVDVAAKFGIPRLVFHGSSYFSMSVVEVMTRERPFSNGVEEFVVPCLPDKVTLTKSTITPELLRDDWETPRMKIFLRALEAEKKSFGIIMNSFSELETKYVDYYRDSLGKTAWSVGPLSLSSNYRNSTIDKATRGKKSAIDEQECVKWLDSKQPNSVIYVSFGSAISMCSAQLREIAIALEASEHNFIWVLKRANNTKDDDWLPDSEFERRNIYQLGAKGLIIKGWAPQVLILDHEATGAFVTHCGWNSTLEGIAAGVPMVTWPVFAEQFINEKLVTQILKTGIPVGSNKYWNRIVSEISVRADAIEKAIRRVMQSAGSEEATQLRRNASELKEMALRAMKKGGSSHQGLANLISQVRSYNGIAAAQQQGI